jgi:hypothetical protein
MTVETGALYIVEVEKCKKTFEFVFVFEFYIII